MNLIPVMIFRLKLSALLRKLNLLATRMPGTIVFQLGMPEYKTHGYIWVASNPELIGQKSIRIGFRCENDSGVRKCLPYVQEEIILQARQAGFEPIYLSCRLGGQKGFAERTIDPEVGRSASA